MKRIKIREIHEKSWCPELFRDSLTEFLSVIWTLGVYGQAMERIKVLLKGFKSRYIVDLCSGAGDYMVTLLKTVKSDKENSNIILYKTDLYPNKKFFVSAEAQIRYWQEPLAADRAFSQFDDALFTMFSALHHFDEPELLKIFSHAARNNKSFSFFDVSQRRFFTDIFPNVFLPGMLWCAAPFFKRFTWKHFVFIYLFPIIPLIVFIDGTLSRMRAYTQRELQLLADRVQKHYPDYRVEVREMSLMGGMQKITEVTGCPRSSWEKVKQFEKEISTPHPMKEKKK